MARIVVFFAYIALFAVGLPVASGMDRAEAANASLKDAMTVMTLGSENAPITMIEYASLSCSHCGAFHRDTLPKIKKNYIDTGKVRLIYHDFPLGGLAMAGSMLARCAGPDKFFGFISALFQSQSKWTTSETPRDDIGKIARLAGLSEDDIDECLDNEALQKAILDVARDGQVKYDIKSTPTFVINGKRVPGNLPYEDFQDLFAKAMK